MLKVGVNFSCSWARDTNRHMDIFSHGLYGSALFGRKSKKRFWTAFLFGIAPDLFSFGIFTATVWLGLVSGPDWGAGPPDPSSIPSYVDSLYNITHSLIIFAFVFLFVWAIRKKPMWEMCAWGFHIILDIFTHGLAFFPTPFLWPLLDYKFAGISWGTPIIFIPNVLILLALYGYWGYQRRKRSPA